MQFDQKAGQLYTNSFIITVGSMCYSIYLLHSPLLKFLANHYPISIMAESLLANTIFYTIFRVIPIPAVSILYFVVIEKP
jgi:peptidoglycan/LPS O-acetylase OafA/YrhL